MSTDRRGFLKLSAAAAGAAACGVGAREETPAAAGAAPRPANWAGNLTYGVDRIHEADSVEAVRELVRSQDHLKALGTRHCFSDIADSDRFLLSVRDMAGVVELDAENQTVTVEAGASYGQLCPYLDEQGFALHNLASLPHISVAGACATATHGSGVANANLAAAASGLELVTASGDVLRLSRDDDPDEFAGAVVHLGALGVLTKVTLDVEPAYRMRQHVYLDLPVTALDEHFEDIVSAGYSVSLFTDWNGDTVEEVWIKSRVGAGSAGGDAEASDDFFGARLADRDVHPIVELSAEHCTRQMGIVGPWYERLPHFRMGFTPSSGDELQAEYFVPLADAPDALAAVARLRDEIHPHLYISELRTVAADGLWMSTAHGRDSLAIHFTWKPDWESVRRVLPMIERELGPFAVRPHWGKLFTMAPDVLRSRYERLDDFRALAGRLDPAGKFRNRYLETHLFA